MRTRVLIARSATLESSSTRPSVKSQEALEYVGTGYGIASVSLDLTDTRARGACKSVKRSRAIAAARS